MTETAPFICGSQQLIIPNVIVKLQPSLCEIFATFFTYQVTLILGIWKAFVIIFLIQSKPVETGHSNIKITDFLYQVKFKTANQKVKKNHSVEIHVDIDAALAEIDAVEFDSISTSDHFYPRRKYFVIGSCCFLNNLLVRSHASRVEQRLISIAQSIVRLDRDEICKLHRI